jgi:hypothetical protein
MSTYDMLRAHYATRSDEELKAIGNAPDLPKEAKRALTDEIATRGMDPEIRRQAAVAAVFAALEQEKQDRLNKSRRMLRAGVIVGFACFAALAIYTLRVAFPRAGGHGGFLLFVLCAVAFAFIGLAIRRRKRTRQEQPDSQDPPTF